MFQIDGRVGATGSLGTLLLLLCWPLVAEAEPAVVTEALRDWPSPRHTSPYAATVDNSVDGVTLMMMDRGEPADGDEPECVVVVADASGALAYEYRHRFLPTRCLDAVAHPDGGFFVRGEAVEDLSDEIDQGFLSRIDAEGEVRWSVEDEELLGLSARPNGPGEFTGNHAGATPGLSYDASSDRVLGLTHGARSLPSGEYLLHQAHIVDGETGDLRVVGQRFGSQANDEIIDVVARDDEFLVHTLDDVDGGPQFYSYDGSQSVSRLNLEDADWSERKVVAPIRYEQDFGTFILWTSGTAVEPTTGIARIEGLDDIAWSREYDADAQVSGEPTFLGSAERIWVGDSLVVIKSRDPARERYLRFIDIEDGAEVGVFRWNELVEFDSIDIVRDDQGGLLLLAVDPAISRVWQHRLDLVDSDTSSPDGDGADDAEEDDAGGCSMSSKGPSPPGLIAFGILVFVAKLRTWN